MILTGDGSLCAIAWSSLEHLLTMNFPRDGTVFYPIAANISFTVGPLQGDAVVCLGHSLKVRGGIQCLHKQSFFH